MVVQNLSSIPNLSPSSLALIVAVLSCIVFLIETKRKHKGLPPGPLPLPIVGHLHILKPPIHRSIDRITTRYGPLISLRFGSTLCIVAGSADLARECLKTHDGVFTDRPSTAASRQFAYEDGGFAFAPFSPYWRFLQRISMNELLGSHTVAHLQPVRNVEMTSMLHGIFNKAELSETVNLSKEIMKLTNNAVTRMAASNAGCEEVDEASFLVKQVAEIIGSLNLDDFVGICKGWDLQGLGRRMKDVHTRFDKLLEGILRSKEEDKRKGRKTEMKDLFDRCLEVAADEKAELKLTRENIKGLIMDLFTAGSDSPAATIEWTFAEVINHPKVLNILREEIDRVVGTTRLVAEADLPNLPYLNAVIKESMRLHPAATLAHRQSIKEAVVGGYTIPAKTTLFVNLWSVNRDPKYWDDPNEFMPERFLDGPNAQLDLKGSHYQLLPFGSGRRVCPGMALALQLVPVVVAVLVQCFEWKVTGDEKVGHAKVDMEEGIGLVSARVRSLVLAPVPRLDPFPSM